MRGFLFLFFILFLTPSFANLNCTNALTQRPEKVSAEEKLIAERVAARMLSTCPTYKPCDVKVLASKAIEILEEETSLEHSLIRKLLLIPLRALHVGFSNLGVVTPSLMILYFFGDLPENYKQVVGIVLGGSIGTLIFGRFPYAYAETIEAFMQKISYQWWGGHTKFRQIHQRLLETERLQNSFVFSQNFNSDAYFKQMAGAVTGWMHNKTESMQDAVNAFANIILDCKELFGALNLDHPSVLRKVRSAWPAAFGDMALATSDSVLLRIKFMFEMLPLLHKTILTLPNDAISPDLDREEVVQYATSVLMIWLFGKETTMTGDFKQFFQR